MLAMQARGGTLIRDNRTDEQEMNSGISNERLSIQTITKKNGGVVVESGRDQLQLSIYCKTRAAQTDASPCAEQSSIERQY